MSTLTYLNFDAQIERSGDGYVMFVESPAGAAIRMSFEPPFSDLELENFLLRAGPSRRGVRRIDTQEVEAAKEFGRRMFNALFSDEVRGALQSSLDEARRRTDAGRSRVGLRIRLRLAGAPELANLPWEYIYNSSLNRFLALSVETPIVRYLDLSERIRPVRVTPPLRIVVMIAGPRDYPQLDVQQEWARLQAALIDLQQAGLVELDLLETPTLPALQRQLRRGNYHILHFIGHGGYDPRTQDGLLVLEDDEQRGRMVSGQDLGMLLHDHTSLRLAILNACEGARTGSDDPFAGVAQSLVQQGIPAVIAMQFEITDSAAITFAHEFYRAIADDYPVDASLTEARKVMFAEARGNGLEWGTPVLYMRSPDGRVFDVQKRRVENRASAIEDREPLSVEPQPVVAVASTYTESRPPDVATPIPEPDPAHAPTLTARPANDEPVVRGSAVSETTLGKQADPARRRSMLPVVAGVLLLLVLGAGVVWGLLSSGVLSSPPVSEPPSDEAVSYFDAGKTAFENSDYEGALAEFDQAINLNPEYLDAYFWRGQVYANMGKYDEAIADFDEVIRLKPDFADAYFAKGQIYTYRDESDDAIAQFSEAITYDSEFLDAYLERGEEYFDQGNYDSAFEDFSHVVAENNEYAAAYWYRGQIYYMRNDYENALADYNAAIRSYPEFVEAYLDRGDLYMDTGEEENAIADFRKVLELTQDEGWRAQAEEKLRELGEEP